MFELLFGKKISLSRWVDKWVRERCMSHQSDWSYCELPNQIATCNDDSCVWTFHPQFRMTFFVYLETGAVILYWPYCGISNALFTVVKPRTLWLGFKRVQNLNNLSFQGSKLSFLFGSQLATNGKKLVTRSWILFTNVFYIFCIRTLSKHDFVCYFAYRKSHKWRAITTENNMSETVIKHEAY